MPERQFYARLRLSNFTELCKEHDVTTPLTVSPTMRGLLIYRGLTCNLAVVLYAFKLFVGLELSALRFLRG